MQFLDSNVLAYAFYQNENMRACQEAIKKGGVTDALNLIEAFFIIEKESGSREVPRRSIKGLLRSGIEVVNVDVNVVFDAVKLMNRFKLTIFDAVHYTCALARGCDAIVTYDRDFDRADIPRREP